MNIKETLQYIANCNLYIGNDTGWAHISLGLNVKALTIFCDSPVAAYGSYSSKMVTVEPEILAAVDGKIDVLLDGGIRRGSDVVKALCLGAKGVLIGRAYAYGLAAAGGKGVARAIEILQTDIVRTMKLLGCGSIADLNKSYIQIPESWESF